MESAARLQSEVVSPDNVDQLSDVADALAEAMMTGPSTCPG